MQMNDKLHSEFLEHDAPWTMSSSRQKQSDFMKIKEQSLRSKDEADRSRKGSVDAEIVDLVDGINRLDDYFTTSSCAGRVVVYTLSNGRTKRGCKWLLVAHTEVSEDEILSKLHNPPEKDCDVENHLHVGDDCVVDGESNGTIWLKFEGFILHVRAKDMDAARRILNIFLDCGFKNSGVCLSKNGHPVVACRGATSLQVPLADGNTVFASPEYVRFLVANVNEKFSENRRRHAKLLVDIQKRLPQHAS